MALHLQESLLGSGLGFGVTPLPPKDGAHVLDSDRRQHRRLDINLPVVYATVDQGTPTSGNAATVNISTGGIYFGVDKTDLDAGRVLNVELTIPPGQGHFPYEGRISSLAEVVRVDQPSSAARRWGVAAQFRDAPKLDF